MSVRGREFFSAIALILLSVIYAGNAFLNYDLGTLRRMGPGFFPFWLGVILFVLGIGLAIRALRGILDEEGMALPKIRFAVPFFIFLGMILFTVLIRPFGVIPAISSLVIVSSMADTRFRPVRALAIAAFMCGVIWFIFGFALDLPITMIGMPG